MTAGMTMRRRTRRYPKTMNRYGSTSSWAVSSKGLTALVISVFILGPCVMGGWALGDGSRGDGNDSFDTAVEAVSDIQNIFTLNAVSDPDDFYWIDVQRGQIIEAYLIILPPTNSTPGYNFSNPEEVDFDLEIFGNRDHDVALASSKTTNQFEAESLVACYTDKYYFRLHAVNNTGTYNFVVTVKEAVLLNDGMFWEGDDNEDNYVKQDYYDEADWFRIELQGGDPAQAVRVTMTHDATGNLDLFLMDLWSQQRPYYIDVSWFSGPPQEEVYGVASYTGTYYLKVHAYSGHSYYSLKVEISEAPTDNNNDKSSARLLDYNTTWTDRVDQSMDKYDFFEVHLLPQEVVEMGLELLDSWDDIYSIFLLDVDLKVILEKTNYIFSPSHDTGPKIITNDTVPGGVYYIMVMAKVALKANPDDLSDDNAASDYRLVINMSKHPMKPTNRAPNIIAGMENLSLTMDEDTTKYLNMNDVFEDPDGDKLVFDVMNLGPSEDLRVSVDMGGTMTIIPKQSWFGVASLNLSAKDPDNMEVFMIVMVTVVDRPEPPIVVDYGPSRTTNMMEGENRTFFVVVQDEDSPHIDYAWRLDGVEQEGNLPQFTFQADYQAEGFHNLVVIISDGDTNVNWDWAVSVNNTNRAPLILDLSPKNGTHFNRGKDVNIVATIEDPDGDALTFELREGIRLIALGSDIQPNVNHSFSVGRHTLKLQVRDDKGGTVSESVNFKVVETDQGPNWSWTVAGILVALVIAFIIYAYAPRDADHDTEAESLAEKEIVRKRKKKEKKALKENKGTGGGRRKKGGRKGKDTKRGKRIVKRKVVRGMDDDMAIEIEREIEEERKRIAGKDGKDKGL